MPTIFSALGVGLAIYTTYKLLDAIWLYSRPSSLGRYLYPGGHAGRTPAWALVTGASDGIGRALADELAAAGFNLLLHGRNAAKLQGVADDLVRRHATREKGLGALKVRTLVADGEACLPEDMEAMASAARDAGHLTVVVNCAGAGPRPSFGPLEHYAATDILANVRLNAAFPALVTAAMVPVLRAAGGPALLLNIASITDTGMPLVSFYSAGKAFGNVLMRAVSREALLYEEEAAAAAAAAGNTTTTSSCLEVLSHRLSQVTSTSHEQRAPSLLCPSATTVARAILARTGCGRKSVVPYWPHALQQLVLGAMPDAWVDCVLGAAMRDCLSKQQQQQAQQAAAEAAGAGEKAS